MSFWEDGIPERFMTPMGAVALGLFVGGAFMIYQEIKATVRYYVTEPTTAPICYPTTSRKHEAGTQRIPARRWRDRSGRSIDDPIAAYDPDRVLRAAQSCTPQGCDASAMSEYKSALFWYVSSRTMHITKLDRDYGDKGLKRARDVYRTKKDKQIEQDLRERYEAGVIRINDFKQDKEAITILILVGGDALRPCRWDEVRQ